MAVSNEGVDGSTMTRHGIHVDSASPWVLLAVEERGATATRVLLLALVPARAGVVGGTGGAIARAPSVRLLRRRSRAAAGAPRSCGGVEDRGQRRLARRCREGARVGVAVSEERAPRQGVGGEERHGTDRARGAAALVKGWGRRRQRRDRQGRSEIAAEEKLGEVPGN